MSLLPQARELGYEADIWVTLPAYYRCPGELPKVRIRSKFRRLPDMFPLTL